MVTITDKEKYLKIIEFIHRKRREQKIIPTPGFKSEPSCFMNGEFHNLLWFQLMKTPEGDGGWLELKDATILDGIFEEVKRQD